MGRRKTLICGVLGLLAAGVSATTGVAEAQLPASNPAARAQLLTPADGESGVLINPTFTWTSGLGNTWGDRFELRRVEGDRLVPLLRVFKRRYELLQPSLRIPFDFWMEEDSVDEIATTGLGTFQLKRAIPPGTYEWAVASGWGAQESLPFRFTVLPQPLGQLVVRTSFDQHGDTKHDPGVLWLETSSVPYGDYRFEYRRGTEVLHRERWLDGRDGKTVFMVDQTCERPGGTLRWSMTVRDAAGNERRRSGSTANATRSVCERLHRDYDGWLEAERRRTRERARRDAERERRRRDAERRRREENARARREQVARFRTMCDNLAGRLVIFVGGRDEYRCYLPNGDYIDL